MFVLLSLWIVALNCDQMFCLCHLYLLGFCLLVFLLLDLPFCLTVNSLRKVRDVICTLRKNKSVVSILLHVRVPLYSVPLV